MAQKQSANHGSHGANTNVRFVDAVRVERSALTGFFLDDLKNSKCGMHNDTLHDILKPPEKKGAGKNQLKLKILFHELELFADSDRKRKGVYN